MLVCVLQSPLSYIIFILACLPASLIFAGQFSSGRMNTFFGIYTRRKTFQIYILFFIGFWLITYLVILFAVSFVSLIQNGAGNGSQFMLLSDKTILTQKEFIFERLPLFILFSLQISLFFLYLNIKMSSANPALLASGLIVIFHYSSLALELRWYANSRFNPISFLNMDFDLSHLKLAMYCYLIGTAFILFFLLRNYFLKYQDR